MIRLPDGSVISISRGCVGCPMVKTDVLPPPAGAVTKRKSWLEVFR
jgi:hypothetical protein